MLSCNDPEGDQRRSPLINSNEWEHPAWKNWRLL